MAATDTAPPTPPDGTEQERQLAALRRRHLLIGTLIGLLALAAAVGAALVTQGVTEDDEPEPAELGEVLENPSASGLESVDTSGRPAPGGDIDDLDGGTFSLTDYRGQPLVVNFFGSWCVPCRKEMPDLQRVHERFGDRVAFVGIAVNDRASDARDFVEEMGTTYDVGRDASGDLFPAFGSAVMPSTAFVSADGTIVRVIAGALTDERLQRLIEDELGA